MSSRVGEQFRDRLSSGGEGPLMVVVPSGSFLMGSPSDEEHRDDDEGPLHLVRIAAPFAIGVYPVTFADWDACVSAGGGEGYRPGDEGWGRGQRPVINVSWHDAQSYVEWLSRETGEAYRLPTEAEWEYAARAGTTTPYHTGATISTDQAQVFDPQAQDAPLGPADVGTFAANAWGLHDVHGNVDEWVEDCWHKNYKGAPEDGSAWLGWDYEARVCRGGHWSNHEGDVRSASRGWGWHHVRARFIGFRVVRTMTIGSEKATRRPRKASQTGVLASPKPRSAKRAAADAPPTTSLTKHLRHKTSPPYQVGDRFRDRLSSGGEGPLMVVVPAGSFLMGSGSHEHDERDVLWATSEYEGPVHRVWFRAPFAIAIHPTTFAEWEVCKKAGGLEDLPVEDGERGPGEDPGWGHEECAERPVINASWHDAQSYLAWLSYETGATYRLPSEAEWEYAARAGTTTPYSTGAGISAKQAHYGQAFLRPIDVGTFEPNPWGLHDVHGNVEEWVEDRWHKSYAGAPKDGSAWLDFKWNEVSDSLRRHASWSDRRVTRGGSWEHRADGVRSAYRWDYTPDKRKKTVGFRVARTLAL